MNEYTLVTGATSDIGHQICSTLEESGYSLLMTDLSEEALIDLKSSMRCSDKHQILAIDLSDVESSETLLSGFLLDHSLRVTNAVFAAGVFSVKPIRMAAYPFVKKCFDVSLFSVITFTRILCSNKVNSDSLKNIVMVSSVSAVMGTKGYSVYGAVKASLIGLMKSLAAELAPRVRVNAVMPGGIRTRATSFIYDNAESVDVRYLLGEGKASDVSNLIDFILSDKARWITGQALTVDGGFTSN